MHKDLQSGNINKVPIMLGYTSEEEIAFMEDGKKLPFDLSIPKIFFLAYF